MASNKSSPWSNSKYDYEVTKTKKITVKTQNSEEDLPESVRRCRSNMKKANGKKAGRFVLKRFSSFFICPNIRLHLLSLFSLFVFKDSCLKLLAYTIPNICVPGPGRSVVVGISSSDIESLPKVV